MSLTSDQILNQLESRLEDEADVYIKAYLKAESLEKKIAVLNIALGKLYASVGISMANDKIS